MDGLHLNPDLNNPEPNNAASNNLEIVKVIPTVTSSTPMSDSEIADQIKMQYNAVITSLSDISVFLQFIPNFCNLPIGVTYSMYVGQCIDISQRRL